ncbi:hypothetical protein Tco_0522891 [Tanacetum coccineum]
MNTPIRVFSTAKRTRYGGCGSVLEALLTRKVGWGLSWGSSQRRGWRLRGGGGGAVVVSGGEGVRRVAASGGRDRKKQKPRKPKKKDTQPSGPTTNVADKADNEENVSKHSNDPLLSGKDSLKLEELMALVKKLEKKGGSRTHKLKRLYKVGLSRRVESSEESLGEEDTSKHGRKIDDIDVDEGVTLVDETQGRYGDDQMFDVSDLAGEHVFVAEQGVPNSKKDDVVSTADATQVSTAATIVTITPEDITLAQALHELKTAKPKDKGKGKIVKPEPMKKFSKKDQIRLDEELAFKLQAEEEEEKRLSMEKVEANVSLNEEWNDIQAKIEADQLLAERLQAREQEELTIEERAKLYQQLLEKRRKFFTAKSAEEKRNRPPTKAQKRSIMSTYLKNMVASDDLRGALSVIYLVFAHLRRSVSIRCQGYIGDFVLGCHAKDVVALCFGKLMCCEPNESYDDIQKLFDKAMKRVNTFVDMDTELVEGSEVRAKVNETRAEGSSKRAGEDLQQESTKKQKMDDDKETVELKSLMEVIPDEEEIAVNAIPLATKPPTIILKSFDREDLETLWKLVKAKHRYTRPEEGYERVLWEKRYPLTPATITDMLNRKLQADHWNEMYYQLLKLVTKQLKINEVFGSILLGRFVEIKRLLDVLEVTAAKVRVTTAKQNLVLFSNLNENYAKYHASVRVSRSFWENPQIYLRSRSNRVRGKNLLIKAVRSSSQDSIVPSSSSSNQVFASPMSDRGNIIRLSGRSSFRLIGNLLFRLRLRFKVLLGLDNGVIGSVSDERVCIQSQLLRKGVVRYSQTSKAYIVLNKETLRIKESLNVTFDEIFPEPKSSPSIEDDRIIEHVVQDPVRSPLLEANASCRSQSD